MLRSLVGSEMCIRDRANTEDLQGDIMSPEDIRVAMHGFMEEYRTINKDLSLIHI